ncbi:hypothetical protein BSKO_13102 [Bryopsis sp. KO-2023]|nr:hypothetical protein BSKO_13102 [Bryopsis sp. KO-2023]
MPLSEKEKLQLKQRGDNLRRRQGIGSAKYAEFFFQHRPLYPFTRKTFPVLGGKVEASNEEWDGIDPGTGGLADWLKVQESGGVQTRALVIREDTSGENVAGGSKMLGRSTPETTDEEGGPSRDCSAWLVDDHVVKAETIDVTPISRIRRGGGAESHRTLHRDLKTLMDALRRIPTPRRAARAIEGVLSKPEVQYALEKYGTGSELGLTRKELAAIAVLQNAVSYRGH